MQAPLLSFNPDNGTFFLDPSQPMIDEHGARSFSPYPADFENAELFNIRSAEFSWPQLSDHEFRSFLMFVAHNLNIWEGAKMTIKGWTFASLVAMEGADNISTERVAEMLLELQRAAAS